MAGKRMSGMICFSKLPPEIICTDQYLQGMKYALVQAFAYVGNYHDIK